MQPVGGGEAGPLPLRASSFSENLLECDHSEAETLAPLPTDVILQTDLLCVTEQISARLVKNLALSQPSRSHQSLAYS